MPAGLADEVVTSLGAAVERMVALANLEEFRTDGGAHGGAEPHGPGAVLTGAGAERGTRHPVSQGTP